MLDFGVDDMIDEIVEEYRNKVRRAVKKAEVVARQKIENDIVPEIVSEYYAGYSPKYYWRQHQLYKSVGPYSSLKESNNVFSLKLGIEDDSPFGPGAMNHTSGDGSKYGPGASICSSKKANEGIIFDNFLSGIHPNVPTLHSNLQGTNTVEYANNLLEELIEDELIPLIDSLI